LCLVLFLFKKSFIRIDSKLDDFSKQKKFCGYGEKKNVEVIYENKGNFLRNLIPIIKNANHFDIIGIDLIEILNDENFPKEVMSAIERGVNFRVLVMDPHSSAFFESPPEYILERSDNQEYVRQWINYYNAQENLQNMNFREKFQIRFYNKVPISFLIILNNCLIFCPYLDSSPVIDSPYIRVDKSEELIFESYRSHFETIWSSPKTLSIKKYEEKYGTR
jgi:hypothetical protein